MSATHTSPLPPATTGRTHLVISSKAASGKASISTSRDRISKSRVWGFGGAMSVRVFCSGDMGWWLPLPFGSPGRPLPQPPGPSPSHLAPPPALGLFLLTYGAEEAPGVRHHGQEVFEAHIAISCGGQNNTRWATGPPKTGSGSATQAWLLVFTHWV